MIELTQNYLKELFDYRNGNLYWKVRKSYRIKIGDIGGYVRKDGYRHVGIDDKDYKSHRLIFLYHHGYLPKSLDHIDGNKSNNDIDNLRCATNQENAMNQKKNKSHNGKPTTSKFKGVSWNKRDKKWQVRIMVDGKTKHLGYFDSEIDAAKSYDRAAIEAFGEFAKINEV